MRHTYAVTELVDGIVNILLSEDIQFGLGLCKHQICFCQTIYWNIIE